MSVAAGKARMVYLLDEDGAGGGPKTVVDQLSSMREQFDVEVLHGGSGLLARACDHWGITHRQLPIDRLWKLVIGFPLLVLVLRRMRPDILVLIGQTAGPVGALAGRLAGIRRMVYVAQWPSFYTDWDLWRVVRNHLCEKIPCSLVDRVIAISEGNHYEYLYRRLVHPERLVLLSNCVDASDVPLEADVAAVRSLHGWSPDVCHVVLVARLATQKHVEWLLAAWRAVMDKGHAARLWIVGGGPEEESLKAIAKQLGLDSSCSFLGPQEHGIRFMAAADIVVSTTLYEGHSVAILEAMACGRPIVSNRVDGVTGSYIDGLDGFLVQPGDSQALAERLSELIRDPGLRKRMGDSARASVGKFDRAVVMPRYQALYRSVLNGSLAGVGTDLTGRGDPC